MTFEIGQEISVLHLFSNNHSSSSVSFLGFYGLFVQNGPAQFIQRRELILVVVHPFSSSIFVLVLGGGQDQSVVVQILCKFTVPGLFFLFHFKQPVPFA